VAKISGDVDLVGISNLLQLFATAKCKGFLTVRQERREKVIEFNPVGIRLVSGARAAKPLGKILLRTGRVTQEQLDELLAEQIQTGRPLGEIVAAHHILSKAVVESALREQIADEFCDIFTWSQASFEFRSADEGPPLPVDGLLTGVLLDANVVTILLNAACRMDELAEVRSIIPDEQLIPARQEVPADGDALGLDRNALEEILPLVDGKLSVAEIAEESLYPNFTVLRVLSGLAKAGVLKIRARREYQDPITVYDLKPVRPWDSLPGSGTVMIVSGEDGLRTSLSACARKAGFKVVEADSEAAAREVLNHKPVDAMVLDLPIGTDDGFKLCLGLRNAARAPFILVTGEKSKQAARHAVDSGARYVLLRPVNEALLVERITNILKR
jgi:CheY-like chemotaxis protein